MKPNGGPAFPHMAKAYCQGLDGIVTQQITDNGMTLRDYFAAAALQGITANAGLVGEVTASPEMRARIAYVLADSMLAERDK